MVCSACQAGVKHSECSHADRGGRDHPDDLRVCETCGEEFNARGAKLGADNCPTCDRRAGNGW